MYKLGKSVICLLLILPGHTLAEGLDTLEQKASYSLGVNFANNLRKQIKELDMDAFTRGMQDVMAGSELALSSEEMEDAKAKYRQQMQEKLAAKQAELGKKNKEEGDAFLAANKNKPGVVTTESGLQYKVITPGTGKTPGENDIVVTHYRGTLIDGREFDSSYSRNKPATFPLKSIIKGWSEALQLMKVGGKWELYIPAELAYGSSSRGGLIGPNSTLLFEVELLEIKE